MKLTGVRFWLVILAFAAAIVATLALSRTTTRAAAPQQATPPAQSTDPAPSTQSAQPSATYEGVITDTHCVAKHSVKIAASAGDCTRVCVHSGEHFALVDGDKLYTLEGEPEALKRVAGERVSVIGTLNGTTISVTAVRSTPAS